VADSDPQKRGIQDWLRERKLVRVLVVYAGASWAILEVTDVFIDKLALPQWFFPAALILLLIGLAVVTVTAVVQGATPARAERDTAEPSAARAVPAVLLTWPKAISGGVLTFAVLAAAGTYLVVTRTGGDEAVVTSPNAVAVLPFHTTGASLEVWREGLMDVLAANLDGVSGLRAVDNRTVMSRVGDEDAPAEESIEVARRLGADWAVYGQAVELGGQVRLDARFFNTETGEQVASSSVVGAPDSIMPLMEGMTLELLRGLGAEQGLGDRGQALTSTSLDAVKAFLEGEQAMRRSEWVEASGAFEHALEIDSTFAMAAARLSHAYGWRYAAGNPAVVEAAERALRHADRLPPRERGFLELNHLIEQGRTEAVQLARQLTTRYPDDPELWFQLGEAYYHLGDFANVPDEERIQAFSRALALDSSFATPLIHLVELAAEHRDLEAFDLYIRLYLARDSTSNEAALLRTVRALVRGPTADSLVALERLADLPARELEQLMTRMRDPSWHNARSAVLEELELPRHPVTDRASSFYFWRNLFEVWRGRPSVAQAALEQAQSLRPDHPTVWFYQLANLSVGLGDPDMAPRAIERSRELGMFNQPMGRWVLAAYYLRNDEIDRVVANADTLQLLADSLHAAGDTVEARIATGLTEGLRGLLAGHRGDYREAATQLRRSVPKSASLGSEWIAIDQQRLALANVLTELGEEGEALRILESGFRFDAFWSIPAMLFRAQLYERSGNREKAIRDYAWVSDVLEGCDPEFEPQRELAQRALQQLLAEG